MKKILFVGTYPPPFGGIASHLHSLLPELYEKGYDVVSLTKSMNSNVVINNGVKNIYVNQKVFFAKNFFSCIYLALFSFSKKQDLKWKQFFKVIIYAKLVYSIHIKEKIDLIYIYDNGPGLIIPILKKLSNEKPVALMIFGDFYLYKDKYLKIKKYYYDVLKDADIIFASSKYCADSIKNILNYNFKTEVIYVGVDEKVYFPYKRKNIKETLLEVPESSFVFFFLGRMDKSMGIDFLYENAEKILNLGDDVYLVLAGAKGDFSEKVKNISDEYDKILYYENIPFEKKVDFYQACDVYLAPTMQRHACMGVSIKEAMACGKPVIASNSGGIPEAISDGGNGYIITTNNGSLDSNDFIRKSKMLYQNKLLRKEMGDKGAKIFIEKFTNTITTESYINMINRLEQTY